MELDEFHIAHPAPGTPGHGNAVTSGRIGVGCITVNLAYPSSGQNHRASRKGHDLAGINVEHIDTVTISDGRLSPAAKMFVGNQVQRHPAFMQGNVGMTARHFQQRGMNGLPSSICHMGNAAGAVSPLTGEVQPQRACRIAGERHTLCEQPSDCVGAVSGYVACGVLIDNTGTSYLGIVDMVFYAVVGGKNAHNAALGACCG